MAPTKPKDHKHWSGIQKPKDGMNAAQRRAAAKKAAREATEAVKHLQHQIQKQGDRWVRFQAYSSDDLLYQPIRLWLEYQTARKQKSFPDLVRDRLNLIFQRPREMDVAWARFETDRANKSGELGVELGDFFDDWWSGDPDRSPFFHGWKWWSALGKLDQSFRATFFSTFVDGFDVGGLPIFRIPFTTFEEVESLDIPDFGDPHIQHQSRQFGEERKALRDEEEKEQRHAYEAMQKALSEEHRLADLFKQMMVGAESGAEGSGVPRD